MAIGVAQVVVNPEPLVSGTGSTTHTVTATVAAGSKLLCYSQLLASTTLTNVTDDQGGSVAGGQWTILDQIAGGISIACAARTASTSAGSITVTFTFAASASWHGSALMEITGAGNLVTHAAQAQSGVGTGTDAISSGNMTIPGGTGPCLVAGFIHNFNAGQTSTAGTGFTGPTQYWVAASEALRPEWQRVTSTGTFAVTGTGSALSDWRTAGAIFEEAAAAAPVLRPARRLTAWPEDEALQPRRRARPIGVGESAGLPNVPGLQLWLRADLGVVISGGSVQGWKDQSGHSSNDAASFMVALPVSSINGRQGFRFTGSEYFLGGTNVLVGNSPRTIFAVHQPASASAGTVLCLRASTLKADYLPAYNFGGSGLVYTDGVNAANNAFVPLHTISGVPTIAKWQSSGPGNVLVYAENGRPLAVTQPSGSSTDSGSTGFFVGGGTASFVNYVGDICEILVYDSVLSAGDEAAIQDYLAVRYAIATADVLPRPRRPMAWEEPEAWPTARRARLVPSSGAVVPDSVFDGRPPLAPGWWDAVEPTITRRVRLVPASAAPASDAVPCRQDSPILTLAWEADPWQLQRRARIPVGAVVAADTVLYRRRWPASLLEQWQPPPWHPGQLRHLFPIPTPAENGQLVRPPLVALVNDLEQMCGNTDLGNAVAADSIDMAIAGDT